MKTDGRHLFFFDIENIRAVNLNTKTQTMLKGHDHFITHMYVCAFHLWTACKKKVVQWDLFSLEKQKEWDHEETTSFFEYHNRIVVAANDKVYELGEETPFLTSEDGDIRHLSDRYIILFRDGKILLFIDHQLRTSSGYPCNQVIIQNDQILLMQPTKLSYCNLVDIKRFWDHNRCFGYGHCFSPDGFFIFIRSYTAGKGILLWAQTGEMVQECMIPNSDVVWHPDSQHVLFEQGQMTLFPFQQQKCAGIPSSFFKKWMLPKLMTAKKFVV